MHKQLGFGFECGRKVVRIGRPWRVLMGFGAIGLGLSAVHGEEDLLPAHTLEPVTVIGSRDNIQMLTGSGDFLDLEDIRSRNYDDINRVLRRVPGVYLREEDGFGLFPNISLRGVDAGRSSKVTLMEDGVLSAPAPYSAPAAYYSPTAGRMSAIEVQKGSSQIKYGPQTTGGVINYLSTPVPSRAEGFIRSVYGTNHELRNHGYYGDTIQTPAGRFGYFFEYYDRRSEGFKTLDVTPDFTARDQTGFRKQEPMLKLFWEPDSALYQRFELMLGYTDLRADETYLGLSDADFADTPYRRYAASRFDRITTEQYRSYLRHQIELTPALRLTTTAYYHRFERDWYKERAKGSDIGDPARLAVLKGEAAGELNYRSNHREYNSGGLESAVAFAHEGTRISHQVEAGLRLHLDDVRRLQRDDVFVQIANGAITDRRMGAPGSGGNRKEEARALALYLQDAMTFERLTLVPGVRYERVDLRYTDYDTTGDPGRVTGLGDTTLDVVAPGLGMRYRLAAETTLFGGVYRGHSLPGPRAAARDGIKEETSTGYEIGVRQHVPAHFRTELLGFYTVFDNLIVPDVLGAGGTAEGAENAGGVVTYGLELKVAYDLAAAMDWGFSNPWSLAATWTRAELDSDTASLNEESIFSGGRKGSRVPYVPSVQGSIGTGIQASRWSTFLDVVFVDSSYTTASNVNAPVDPLDNPNAAFGKTDSRIVVDLSGHLQIREHVRLIGSVHNLWDETFVVARHPAGARPGQPRTLLAGMEVRF